MAIATLALMMVAGSAQAEAGALLRPVAEASVSDQDSLTAQQAVISYFAQFPDAIPITPPDEGIRRAGGEFRNCGDASCAQAFAIKLDVDFAVVVRLFAPDRRNGPGSLSAALVTPDGVAYAGNVDINESGVHAAATRAVQLAYERLARGPGPWLKVDGPDSSRVRVDGRSPQALPYMEKIEPGLHRILVEGPSGATLYDVTITLPDDPAHYEQIQVDDKAQPIDSGAVATEVPRRDDGYFSRKRSKWNYIIGAPLTALGIAYTVAGLIQVANKGECVPVKDMPGWSDCNTTDGNTKLVFAVGATTIAIGAGLFMGVGIIRQSSSSSPSGAMLHYQGTF
jgi:hypothetical protein